MAIINWPSDRAFYPQRFEFAARTAKSRWSAFFTGQEQVISHLADRLRCSILLPACNRVTAARREAFLMGLASTGDWVRFGHLQRYEPRGTMRGTPTVSVSAAAGARTLTVQTTAGATMLAGDPLGGGGQLMLSAYSGATANGSGVMSLPLVLPLRAALSAGAALTWQAPTTTWQLETDLLSFSYSPGRFQSEVEVIFREVS